MTPSPAADKTSAPVVPLSNPYAEFGGSVNNAVAPADPYAEFGGSTSGTEKRGFFGTLGDDLASIPQASTTIMKAIYGPPDVQWGAIKSLAQPSIDNAKESIDYLRHGRVVPAIIRAAEAVPIAGPAARGISHEIDTGDYGAAAAHGLELVGPEAAKFLPDMNLRTGPTDLTNPVERSALDYAKGEDIPVSVGQDTGQIGLQRVEQGLQNLPGSATRAQNFYRNQQSALAQAGRDLSTRPSVGYGTSTPSSLDAHGVWHPAVAGQSVIDALGSRVQDLKNYANKLYDSTRQTTARNVHQVQTGTRDIPASTILDSDGNPMVPAQTVPVMSSLETPVDLAPIRQQLKSVYDDLKRNLAPAQQQYSPAFAALKSLMESSDQHMPAMDFDKFLGAMKSISRNGDSPLLTTQSQGMAKQVIKAGEKSFQDAIAGAGPNVADKLSRARKAVAEYHDTADLLGSMRDDEPAALYSNLVTASADKARNMLAHLNQIAPNSVATVGRAFLEGLMSKATAEGGFGRSAGVVADWRRMGPETKQMLFGPELTSNLDNFLLAAKRLTENVNPSGSAHMIAALGGWGAAGEMLRALITGNPMEAAGIGTGAFVAPNIAARILFNPEGVKMLTRAISAPVNSPVFNNAMQGIAAVMQGTKQRNYQPPGAAGIIVP